jgi:hypothetical protein
MPRVQWQLRRGRPCIEVVLTLAIGGQSLVRTLLADTGAASQNAGFQLLLDERDCLLCGGVPASTVRVRGAFTGRFPMYDIAVQIPALGFFDNVRAVGVASPPVGFDGIACFRFLNRFTYGNLGDPKLFGLEC